MKDSTIDLLRIAESNLLYSFKDIKPKEVNKQIAPEVNTISWILGHCFTHLHMILIQTCQDTKMLNDDTIHYFRYGTSKEEIERTESKMTFEELVDKYLEMSAMSYTYLDTLDVADFKKVIFPKPFPIAVSMAYIRDILDKGTYNPVVDSEYHMQNITQAYEYVIQGQKTGNVIINF